ncbi:MAG: N-acetylmuramoyl-L-alanine amidase [Bacteroidetes bacterium]|nr:N-acetylmuramoyl-L-alanine amidase [Bacteroidota bacterium]
MLKKIFTFLFCVFALNTITATEFPLNKFSDNFKKAYLINPSIPKGVLEAIAFSQSKFEDLKSTQPSCIGYPEANGIFGLIENGKGYFRNNLQTVASLSQYSAKSISENSETQIFAYAAAFSTLQKKYNMFGSDLKKYIKIFIELSELPTNQSLQNDFAMNSHLYQIFWFLNNSEAAQLYNFNQYKINLTEVFGDNLVILSSNSLIVSESTITNGQQTYKTSSSASIYSPNYPPALWNPAASCNYSSRAGTQISAVTIHDVEGTYAGCISWFQNCAASVSAHYVVRSSDGQITQMVLEANKAWHVGSENPYTVGIEHEGYNNTPSWYTNAMYISSANLVRYICQSNTINPLRTYYGPGCSGTTAQCLQGACVKVKGHQMFPNQTHNDPGPYWNWAKYYKLINNTYTVTTYTAASGNLYDSGGPSANYSNDERLFWLVTKPGATNITINFSSFNVENSYDNLFIYDGGSVNSPLIGQFTGTVTPGSITTTNDSLLLEFRSDCATTAPGWIASYTTTSTAPTSTDVIPPTTSVTTTSAWITSNFTTTITDVDNLGGSGIDKGYYQVIDYNGTEWRANYTHGFFADNFDSAINPEWTVKTGSWSVVSSALVQSDEASTAAANTNIYASLTQTLSNRYLYHFLAKFEGSQTSRRAGFHFFVDKPDSSNRNNSYFVWFRLDDQKVQLYKVVNNVFGTPKVDLPLTFSASQWYDIKTIYDRITGKINVYMNNALIASWTDPSPITSGSYISFRSGNCKFSIDEIKVYRSRNNAISVSVGSGLANDLRYQNPNPLQAAGKIKSICQDVAGNLSSIYYADINVDWTPPSNIAKVNDGSATDINIVNTTDSLQSNWTNSADTNSGIVRYWYSIGTAPGSTNTLAWTSNWASTSVTAKSLTLTQNTTYYFNIKSENGAGLFSSITSSDGQKVDTNFIATGILKSNLQNNILVYPNPFKNQIMVNLNLNELTKVEVTLIDVLGRKQYLYDSIEQSGSTTLSLNMNNTTTASGAYTLKILLNNKTFLFKLIKTD